MNVWLQQPVEQTRLEIVAEARTTSWRSPLLLGAVLLLAAVVILHGVTRGEFSYNVDESQHAVTGLYVADLVRDHPLTHPIHYTDRYYAQYPALSGVIHWPPFFYLWEGLSFLLLGPTVVAARLCIFFFAALGLSFFFLLVRDFQGDWTAALATALLAVTPTVLLFEKTVMLEVPSMSLALGAVFFWQRYLLQERTRQIYWAVVLASLAMLTKQNAGFLVIFFALTGLWRYGLKWFARPEVLKAFALGFALTAPFYSVVYITHRHTLAYVVGDARISGVHRVMFYWEVLPGQLGRVLLAVSALGILTAWKWEPPRHTVFLLLWLASCYLMFTAIGWMSSRFIICWIPPFVYFAASFLTHLFRAGKLRWAAPLLLIAVVGFTVHRAWAYQRPIVSGYAAAAQQIVARQRPGVILYDGGLPADFIFFMRADDPKRQFIVLRKALYAYRITSRFGGVELVHNREELEATIRDNGVRFIAVSDKPLAFDSQRILRDLVEKAPFHLVGTFPITGTDSSRRDNALLIYENQNWAPPASKFLTIKMLTISHPIVVPFSEYKFLADPPAQK